MKAKVTFLSYPPTTLEFELRGIIEAEHESYPLVNFKGLFRIGNETHQAYYNNGAWETINVMFERHRFRQLAEAEQDREPIQLSLF